MPHNLWHHPHYYKRYNNMFCGPSRLVWFAFGSVATWAWIRHHHHHHHGAGGACPPRVGCGRAQWEQRDHQSAPPNNASSSSSLGRGDFGQQWPGRPQTQTRTQTQTQEAQPESMTPMMEGDHERLRQIGRSAEETISGMSEATIDSMMGGLQRLKDRLAERRGQQQLQEIGPQQANPILATSPEEPTGPRHHV